MNDIESKIGIAMAALLAMAEARGDEAPVILPEIVVTATPRTSATRPTVSVQVVPSEALDDQQVIRLEDALKTVSGVYQQALFKNK